MTDSQVNAVIAALKDHAELELDMSCMDIDQINLTHSNSEMSHDEAELFWKSPQSNLQNLMPKVSIMTNCGCSASTDFHEFHNEAAVMMA